MILLVSGLQENDIVQCQDQWYIAPDGRSLNYDKFYVEGTVQTEGDDAYTSHNTTRLDVDGVVKKIMTTDYVKEELEGRPHLVEA